MVTFANLGSVRLPSSSAFAFGRYDVFRACQLSIYYNSFPVIRTTIAKKSSFLRTPAFIFCLPWGRPVAKRCMNEKTISACQTPRSMCLSIFNSSRVIRCLSQCVIPKIAILTHFGSPGDAPGAITLNVVWMEREFDAYKLSRCMCPSNYNRF